jgi:hypothetical protein
MHLQFLVEDASGKKALDILIPKILGAEITFDVKPYKGIGHIPTGMKSQSEPNKRILLDQLPRLLSGYGKTFEGYSKNYSAAVVVVCDLDQRCLKEFRNELFEVLDRCSPQPETIFCIAIEEMESWFLGDLQALRTAYPKAKSVAYVNDDICGAWEKLADAIYKGGSKALSKQIYRQIGNLKCEWAENISPNMDVENNESPSFQYFRDKIRKLVKYQYK